MHVQVTLRLNAAAAYHSYHMLGAKEARFGLDRLLQHAASADHALQLPVTSLIVGAGARAISHAWGSCA